MARKKPKYLKKSKTRYSKIIVSVILLSVAVFTVTMIWLYTRYGAIPDTLVTAFYSFAGGEAGFLSLIKFSDNKYTLPKDKPPDGGAVG